MIGRGLLKLDAHARTHVHTHARTHVRTQARARARAHTHTMTKPPCTHLIQGPESSDRQTAHPAPNGHERLGQRLRSSRSFQALLKVWTNAFKGAGGQRGRAAGNPLHVLWENKAACTEGAFYRGLCCGFCMQVPSLFLFSSCFRILFMCRFCLAGVLSSSFGHPPEDLFFHPLPLIPLFPSAPLPVCPSLLLKSTTTRTQEPLFASVPYPSSLSLASVPYPFSFSLASVPYPFSLSLASVPYPSSLSLASVPYPSSLSLASAPHPSSLSLASVPYPSSLSPPPAQGRRATMEDTWSLFPADGLLHDAALGGRWRLYGLFDGHGGARCSTFCQQTLLPMVSELLTAGQCVRERVCVCVRAGVTRGFRCPHQSRTTKS